jgi:hypothetical protein
VAVDTKSSWGWLSGGELETNSAWNEFSRYGFHNIFSTWNDFGNYASHIVANRHVTSLPPIPSVLVDRNGNYYGRLSVNQYINDGICGVTGVEKFALLFALCVPRSDWDYSID